MFVQGNIRTQEQFDACHDCVLDLINTLEDFFTRHVEKHRFSSSHIVFFCYNYSDILLFVRAIATGTPLQILAIPSMLLCERGQGL